MPPEEWMWLDGRSAVCREELARMCGLTEAEVDELVEYGSITVTEGSGFTADLVAPLREAMRLRELFDLDLFTAGLLLKYLRRIDTLEGEVRSLRGKVEGHHAERDGPGGWREPHA